MTDTDTHIHANLRYFLNSEVESNPLFSTKTFTRVPMHLQRPPLGNPTIIHQCINCGGEVKIELFSLSYQKRQRKNGKLVILGFLLHVLLAIFVWYEIGEYVVLTFFFMLWGINHYFRNPIRKKSSWRGHNLEYPPRAMDVDNFELRKHIR